MHVLNKIPSRRWRPPPITSIDFFQPFDEKFAITRFNEQKHLSLEYRSIEFTFPFQNTNNNKRKSNITTRYCFALILKYEPLAFPTLSNCALTTRAPSTGVADDDDVPMSVQDCAAFDNGSF